LVVIPARGGSKGVPQKNIRLLFGKPLIAWTVEQSLAARRVGRVVVSTDDPGIAEVARTHGAPVPFLRPPELAQDSTPTEPVLLHAIAELERSGYLPDAVILLQATSPARRSGAIDAAIERFEREDAESLVSVCENHHFFWKNGQAPEALYDFRNRPRRQDIGEDARWYRENGSIYITRTHVLRAQRNRLGGKITMFLMSQAESWEIDTESDFRVLEALMPEVLDR
jgi:N-acylneuraminate cytidylyltransferase